MTWLVGATAFNGLVCVADVQVTFDYVDKSRPPQYFNCLRKLYKASTNLYIGLSGDVRSGLLMIERLTMEMSKTYKPGELFDIEGQLSVLQEYLRKIYHEINPTTTPKLDLMFFWMKQEGLNPFYEPACMRFIAPHFGSSGIGSLQISQSGSGIQSVEFQALVSFLKGNFPGDDLREVFFAETSSIPHLWTASKIRTLLVKEGQGISFPGVSKTFLSVIAELGWNRTVSDETHKYTMSLLDEVGIERRQEKTKSDILHIVEIDGEKIVEKITGLANSNPEKLKEIVQAIGAYKAEENLEPLCQLPVFVEELHCDQNENVSFSSLCTSWAEMEAFMRLKRINVGKCMAVA